MDAELRPDLIGQDAELQKVADDIREIARRFAGIGSMTIVRGDLSVRGLSWRCQAIASANLLRGQELFRFTIQAINEGALIAAYTLSRALDETMAAVVHARRRIQKAIEGGDAERLREVVDRLTCGNRYLLRGAVYSRQSQAAAYWTCVS